MQHLVFTRFNLPAGPESWKKCSSPEWLDERIALFEHFVYSSMKNQTDQNFRWLVLMWEKTPQEQWDKFNALASGYENLGLVMLSGMVFSEMHDQWMKYIRSFVEPGELITTRCDSDDAIHKRFIERVKSTNASPGHFICWEKGLMFKDGKVYERIYRRNPFLSFVETVHDDARRGVLTVNCKQHCYSEPVLHVASSTPMWLQVVHGGNVGNAVDENADWKPFAPVAEDYIGNFG